MCLFQFDDSELQQFILFAQLVGLLLQRFFALGQQLDFFAELLRAIVLARLESEEKLRILTPVYSIEDMNLPHVPELLRGP
jgi:hypothetical protein